MHLNCPHCRNPIEVVEPAANEVLCPSCGSSFHLTDTKSTTEYRPAEHGQMFGRFVVQDKVGMGAFGTVYKAIDGDLHRTVAVKVPRASNFGSSADGIDRFLREARSAAQLRHPSIVTVHEVGMQDQQPYLVSDFVDGVTLADWLTAHEPTFRQAAEWVAELAEALHYAHQQGVVHRDVKPSNIMMTKSPLSIPGRGAGGEGEPHRGAAPHLYLMDFGLAKRDAGEITMTMEGQILGTPAYMSPEQARGEGHAADGRADEYSLGVILYELLARELPFRGNARMLLQQVMEDEPKPLRKINDRIPLDLETICLKAMAKEPARRYADCGQLAADLRRYLKGEPINARPVGAMERGWRWCKRHPAIAGLTAAIAAVLLAATAVSSGLSLWALKEKERADGNAVTARENEETSRINAEEAKKKATEANEEKYKAERLLGLQANREGLRLLDGGDRFTGLLWFTHPRLVAGNNKESELLSRQRLGAYRALEKLPVYCRSIYHIPVTGTDNSIFKNNILIINNTIVRYVNSISGNNIFEPMVHNTRVQSAQISRDGRIILTSTEQSVQAWDAISGKRIGRQFNNIGLLRRLSNDGRIFITQINDTTYKLWYIYNNTPLSMIEILDTWVTHFEFSNNGKWIAITTAHKPSSIWDISSGKVVSTMNSTTNDVNLSFSSDDSRCVVSSTNYTARIFETTTGNTLSLPFWHESPVYYSVFSNDNKFVVTKSEDKIFIWDVASGQRKSEPLIHRSHIISIGFSPDGRMIGTCSDDNSARLWNITSGLPVTPPLYHQHVVRMINFDEGGRQFRTISSDGTHRTWELSTVNPNFPPPYFGNIKNSEFSYDKNKKVMRQVIRNGTTVEICNAMSHKLLIPPLVHPSNIGHMAFSPNGEYLVTTTDETARIWNAETGTLVIDSLKHKSTITHAMFSPDNNFVLTSSADQSTIVWNAKSGQKVSKVDHLGRVNCAAVSPDCKKVVTASNDHTAKIWHLATGKECTQPLKHHRNVNLTLFSPDGNMIATSTSDGFIRVWNAQSGQAVSPPLLHPGYISSIDFSPDSMRLISTSSDKLVRIWDATTGIAISPSIDLNRPILCAEFSTDGNRIIVMAAGDLMRSWSIPYDQRPTTDLLRLAQIYAGHKIDDTGGLQPLDVEKELLPWYNELKAKYPDEFIPRYEDTRRWRLQQIADCCKERNLPAAFFHQHWLLAEAVQHAAKK